MQVDTKTSFQDTQNPDIPKADSNMSDFIHNAQNFAHNATAEGVDPIGIAEGIKFMYGLTQENIKNHQAMTNTPFQQAQADIAQQGENRLGKGQIVFDPKYGTPINQLPGMGINGLPGSSLGSTPSASPNSYDDRQAPASSSKGKAFDPSAFEKLFQPATSPQPQQNSQGLSDIIQGSTAGGPTSIGGLTVNTPSPTGLTIDSQGGSPMQAPQQSPSWSPQQSPMMQGLSGLISPNWKNT